MQQSIISAQGHRITVQSERGLRSEYHANAQGFRFASAGSITHAHRIAYPVACRMSYRVALVLSFVAHVIARHA